MVRCTIDGFFGCFICKDGFLSKKSNVLYKIIFYKYIQRYLDKGLNLHTNIINFGTKKYGILLLIKKEQALARIIKCQQWLYYYIMVWQLCENNFYKY